MTETKKKDLLFEITFDEDSQTMISFLKRRLTKIPLSLIHKLLRTKKVYLTRERELISQIKSSSILKKGDLIEVKNIINEEKNKETKIVPSSPLSTKIYPIRIVYEDNNIVIICKSYD